MFPAFQLHRSVPRVDPFTALSAVSPFENVREYRDFIGITRNKICFTRKATQISKGFYLLNLQLATYFL